MRVSSHINTLAEKSLERSMPKVSNPGSFRERQADLVQSGGLSLSIVPQCLRNRSQRSCRKKAFGCSGIPAWRVYTSCILKILLFVGKPAGILIENVVLVFVAIASLGLAGDKTVPDRSAWSITKLTTGLNP